MPGPSKQGTHVFMDPCYTGAVLEAAAKEGGPKQQSPNVNFICRDSPQGFFFTRRYEGRDRDCVRLLNRTAHKFQSKTLENDLAQVVEKKQRCSITLLRSKTSGNLGTSEHAEKQSTSRPTQTQDSSPGWSLTWGLFQTLSRLFSQFGASCLGFRV